MTAETHAGQPAWPAPAPGAAPLPRMVAAQAGLELRTMARNGEQLLLVVIIPVLLLAAFSREPLISFGPGRRIDFLAPGILALAVMSTAFTSQAIATGFERRYGVLKRLGATPLERRGLIGAKTLAVLAVEVLQVILIVVVSLHRDFKAGEFDVSTQDTNGTNELLMRNQFRAWSAFMTLRMGAAA